MAKFEIGETIVINGGGTVTVLTKPRHRKVTIQHNDHIGHIRTVGVDNLDMGNIKNPYAVTVFGVGYPGYSTYPKPTGEVAYRYYKVWYNLIKRVYSRKTTFTVWPAWLDYQVWLKWYQIELVLVGVDKLDMQHYLNDSGCYMPLPFVSPEVESFYQSYASNVKDNANYVDATIEDGVAFGYPRCCVDSFITDIVEVRMAYREPRKLEGTGYIPCATCDTRLTEQQLIDKINENRDPSRAPFKI